MSRRAANRARRNATRYQCGAFLDEDALDIADDRCVEWYLDGQGDEHHAHRTADGRTWRTPIERWGAPYPSAPTAQFLAIHRAKTPADALRAALVALDADSEAMASSSQEYGWFVGHGDAAQTITDLLETLEAAA